MLREDPTDIPLIHEQVAPPGEPPARRPAVDRLHRGPGLAHCSQFAGYGRVRVMLGIVLLVAAGLKARQFASSLPLLGTGSVSSAWFPIAIVEVELLLGLLLLSGLFQHPAWVVAIIFFVAASFVSLYSIFAGNASCGCFGDIEVSPWFTLLFDLFAVSLLLLFRPRPQLQQSMSIVRTSIVGLLFLMSPLLFLPLGMDKIQVLEPQSWIGERLPILGQIDIGARLMTGRWKVVFVHHDCRRCREKIGNLPSPNCRTHQAAVIQIPPYGQIPARSDLVSGSLSNRYDWFVETPVVLTLNNGIVMEVAY